MTLRLSVTGLGKRARNASISLATAAALLTVGAVGTALPAAADEGDDAPAIVETATAEPVQVAETTAEGTLTIVNGSLADGSRTGQFAAGTEIQVEANAAEPGMIFTGWAVSGIRLANASSPRLTFEMPDGDVRLVANYVRAFSLAVGLGTVNETEMFGIFAPGSVLELAAFDAPAGQVFDRWNVVPESLTRHLADPTAPVTTFRMPRADVLIRASYSTAYTLNLSASPAEGGSVNGSGEYPAGRDVNVAAQAATGFIFAGWSVSSGSGLADATVAETTVEMPTQDVVLVANFERVTDGVPTQQPTSTATPTATASTTAPVVEPTAAGVTLPAGWSVWLAPTQTTSPLTDILLSAAQGR